MYVKSYILGAFYWIIFEGFLELNPPKKVEYENDVFTRQNSMMNPESSFLSHSPLYDKTLPKDHAN